MVRAKFTVNSIERSSYGSTELQSIKLSPVYSGSEENKQFFAATPGGSIQLSTLNPEAAASFVLGGEVYVDFTPVEKAPDATRS